MFKVILQEIVDNTEGAVAAVLMGFDGIAVDSYQAQDSRFDVEDVAMEYSVLLGQIKKAAEMLEIGTMREVAVQAEHMTIVIRLLSEEYFLAMVIKPQGNQGKARFLMRTKAEKLLENLS